MGGGTVSGGNDVHEALVAAARERLRAGAAPAGVCGELAARTPRWGDAALAVGLALGIAEPEMSRRLRDERERVHGGFRPGEEELYGELLETTGVFDVPKRLDGRETAIVEHLWAATRAMGGVASRVGLGLSRSFATGEVASAFRLLTRVGPRAAHSRPADFWAALVAAGELLGPADGDEHGAVTQALDECRRRLADCT
ncbi:hypothetical protein [Streptomyces sp. I05A-00742]|uniref:hypothetical protein n=1 Tax=Streptomyces sp. I05A-00742 TaxID=2732853 RepID=UPI001488F364|nr:hypothetical protein [Streptomyces sp. I05A-00742]